MIETLLQPSSEKDHNLLNSTISNDFKVFLPTASLFRCVFHNAQLTLSTDLGLVSRSSYEIADLSQF